MSNILFIKSGSKIKAENNSLKVLHEEITKEIHISEITCVIIENLQCSITSAVNVLCNSNNIPIIYCDNKHNPVSISNSFNTYHKQFFKLNEQIKWSDSKKKKLFYKMIVQKIENQRELLKYINKNYKLIEKKLEIINKNNFENVEAIVAKIYFKELFGEEFIRFKEDEINASLNYGYTILRSIIKQTIVAKGLVPPLGLWHKSQFNNYNLADDIIEVFRPMVDYVTYHFTIKDNEFSKIERIYLQNVIFQKIKYNNQTFEYQECLEHYINDITRFMNGSIKTISLPKLDSRLYEY